MPAAERAGQAAARAQNPMNPPGDAAAFGSAANQSLNPRRLPSLAPAVTLAGFLGRSLTRSR
jgi:hypothetical protein